MSQIAIIARKCTGCGDCVKICPFGAIQIEGGQPQLNSACVACGACMRACASQAIVRLETRGKSVDKSQWKGILVYAEQNGGKLHPVSLELIGKALTLVKGSNHAVKAVLLGENIGNSAQELCHYGVSEVYVYDSPQLAFFRADTFAACVEDTITDIKPQRCAGRRYNAGPIISATAGHPFPYRPYCGLHRPFLAREQRSGPNTTGFWRQYYGADYNAGYKTAICYGTL